MATKKGLTKGIACFIVLGLLGIGWASEKEPSQEGKEQKMTQTQEDQIIKQKQIHSLIQDLDSEDKAAKVEAIKRLGDLGIKEAAPKLFHIGVYDKDKSVAIEANKAFHKIKEKYKIKDLITFSSDIQEEEEVKGITQKDITRLIQDLDSENKEAKVNAIWKLGILKVNKVVPKIIDALQDNDWAVKANACKALGKIKSKEAFLPILEVLKDEDEHWSIRVRAGKALAEIDDVSALEHLIDVLKDECMIERKDGSLRPPPPKSVGSDDEAMEIEYVIIIIDLCSKDKDVYTPILFEKLEKINVNKDYKVKYYLDKLRYYLAYILGRLEKKEVVPILIEYLENSKNGIVRDRCAWLLGDLGDKRAIEPLKKALKDDFICIGTGDVIGKNYGYSVRHSASVALKKLGVKVERINKNEYRVVEEEQK